MDPRRAKTERNMLPTVGASFYRDGDDVLFVFVIDPGNIMGPRPATRADQQKHAGAWAAFCAADDVSALDRDASGEDGGSLPSESPVVVAVQAPALFDEAMVAEFRAVTDEIEAADMAPAGGRFVTKDGAEFSRLSEAADHVEREVGVGRIPNPEQPRQKRKYTRRKG